MKILSLCTSPDLPEIHTLLGLKRQGAEMFVVADPAWLETAGARALADSSITALPIKCSSRFDLKAVKKIRNLIKSEGIRLVHSFSARSLSNAIIASFGMNILHVAYRGTTGHINKFDPASWLTYLNPKISKIVAVSDAVKAYLSDLGISQDKIVTIHKGHDLAWYGAPYDSSIWKSLLPGIGPQPFIIVMVANIRPVKGLAQLISAFSMACAELSKNLHLVVIGKDSNNSAKSILKDHQKIADRVHMLGYRSDATRLIGAASLVVLPSLEREGLPKSLIEAMAQSIPCVATSVGGVPELIIHNQTGILVEPRSVESLAKGIVKAATEKEFVHTLSHNAYNHIRQKFSIKDTVRKTFELYQELLND
jgi:glycosyltransferase involved in cell wall biosynthesis